MGKSVYQRVIDFTAAYLSISPSAVSPTDSYSALGIPGSDMPIYMEQLELSFSLIYNPGDENGIVIVDDAIRFIKNKLGPQP